MRKIIGDYQNGNYRVIIFEDGTKIRHTRENEFIPSRLESVDMKITNMCDMGCPFCHEKSVPNGKHANLDNSVIDTFLPYTEIAIGGGNPLCHPDLEKFLRKLKELKCFPSMTVNQKHFLEEYDRLLEFQKENLFYGLGISVSHMTQDLANKILQFPNAVVHTIAGITTSAEMREMSNLGIKKVLVLGYKVFGRGESYYNEQVQKNIDDLKADLKEIPSLFEVLSFDNLALNQLDVKSLMTNEEWEEFYMGDDGGYTMYIDLVNEQYGQSSTSKERFSLLNTINDMFLDIRERKYKDGAKKQKIHLLA